LSNSLDRKAKEIQKDELNGSWIDTLLELAQVLSWAHALSAIPISSAITTETKRRKYMYTLFWVR
jgi:hypothetical protein